MEDKKQRVKLTKRLIDSLTPPEAGQVFLRDISLVGFAVRVTHGSKSFILERRIHGRPRRITLGSYPPMTIEGARSKAEALIGEIANGRDPAQERIGQKREITFGDLEQMYRERHLPLKRSAFADEWMLKTYLTSWRTRKLSSINRRDIIALHGQIGQNHSHYTANRVISLLRKMLNCAKAWEVFLGENPVTQIELFPEEKRTRFIQAGELPRLFESLRQEPNIFIRGIILTLLFTGARKSEALTMKYSDIDLNQGTWTIPQTKAGRPHTIPLPGPLIELLRSLPMVADNPYVFPGKGSSYFRGLQKVWENIRTRAGISDVRIHDLRRSAGSWLAGAGFSLPIIGKILNHSQPQTTAIYGRLDLEPVRAALEDNVRRMLLVAGPAPGLENQFPEGQENAQVENPPTA